MPSIKTKLSSELLVQSFKEFEGRGCSCRSVGVMSVVKINCEP